MSKMWQQQRHYADRHRYENHPQSQGLRLDQGVPGLPAFQYPRYLMRTLRHGKREAQNHYAHEGDTRMSGLRQSFLELIRTLGNYSGCHQMPERSFFYKGKQFPVCARCTGVFFGQLTAVLLVLSQKLLPVKWAAVFLAAMGVDWGIQETGIKESTNIRRLITGFLGGFGLFSLYFRGIRRLLRLLR